MELSQLMPGSPIELRIAKFDENQETIESDIKPLEEKVYMSSLFDLSKSGELIVHIPTKQGHYIALPMDLIYQVVINTGMGLFELNGRLINKGKIEKFPVYVIQPVTDIKKIQRRNYFRFECAIPVMIHPIPREIGLLPTNEFIDAALKENFDDVLNDISGTILDISGGGARINARVDINTDSYMLLKFDLFTNDGILPMKIVARRVKSSFKEEVDIYEHRIEFLFKENDDREVIIKYIFDEQRRLMKNKQG